MASNPPRQPDETHLFQQLERFCAYQERCSRDVVLKLRRMQVPAAIIDRMLRKLKEDRFLDEERFTRFFVRGKFRINKWGRIRIRFELSARGIPATLINKAIAEEITEDDYRNSIRTQILKKKREIKAEKKLNIRDKIINFVIGKGYESDRVLEILNELKI
jgi:regulatory protein